MVRLRGFRSKTFAIAFLASLITSVMFSAVALSAENIPVIPVNPTIIQSGTTSCTVNSAQSACVTPTISFTPSYTNIPLMGHINLTLNPILPTHTQNFVGTTSNLITFQTPGNQTILFYDDEVTTTINIPIADTVLKLFAPTGSPPNGSPWPNVIVEGEGWITTAVLSTKQVISIFVENCAGTIYQTLTFETESLAIGRTPFAIKGIVPLNIGLSAWCIDVKAPAADANTQISLVSMRLYGEEQGFRTWINMPTSLTEIYGSKSNEQKYTFAGSNPNPTWTFCVYIQSNSNNVTATSYLTPYMNGFEISSGLRVLIANGVTGLQCSTATIGLSAQTSIVTVFGANGGGIGDLPAFGTISLSWSQSINVIVTVPVGYHVIIQLLTISSFKLRIQFDATLSASNIVTFNWKSIGS